jgi:site-specific recombinase XerD
METARQIGSVYSLLIKILLQTGLRISELQAVDLRDIRKDNNTLIVMKGQGKKQRIVQIGYNLIEMIFLYCKP